MNPSEEDLKFGMNKYCRLPSDECGIKRALIRFV